MDRKYATKFLVVGANLILVGLIGKMIKDNVSRVLPEQDDINEMNKKLSSYMFWDAMFPHGLETPLPREDIH